MQFIDEVNILVKAGDGGNGAVAWRREKFLPLGGPAGGDGGNGGDLIFITDINIHSLLCFQFNSKLTAKNGKNGLNKDKFGSNGNDLIVKIPIGTKIFNNDNGEVIADLTKNNEKIVICRGGSGGHGNARFANSKRQSPYFAKLGLPGEEFNLKLNLKIMADVGLLGLPNSGKSTLLSVITSAKPKIANYPFSTLTPQLGVIKVDDFKSLVIADMPGVIKGASIGLGLGFRFLKHLERVRLLCHLIEYRLYEKNSKENDLIDRYESIRKELINFSPILSKLQEIVVLTKFDLVNLNESNMNIEEFEKYLSKRSIKLIKLSSLSNIGINELIKKLINKIFN